LAPPVLKESWALQAQRALKAILERLVLSGKPVLPARQRPPGPVGRKVRRVTPGRPGPVSGVLIARRGGAPTAARPMKSRSRHFAGPARTQHPREIGTLSAPDRAS
jgi:hypothetical protein